MVKKAAQKEVKGFTLVELLVVIAIIAILAAVIVLIINPLELTRRGRDATRLSDLDNLQHAITVILEESSGSATQTILCGALTPPCKGDSVNGNTSNGVSSVRKTDSTGWVPINLSNSSLNTPTLPVDPTNTATNHYTYCSDGNSWEIDTKLESQQQSQHMANDGGDANNLSDGTALYEVGSNLTLIGTQNLCTY